MPSLNLRNAFRRNSDRPTLRERAASLKSAAAKVIRRPKPESAATTVTDAAAARAILDTILVSRAQELIAIEASQDATLRATSYPDAYDCPDWVEMERAREIYLAQVIGARAHSMEGVKAKATVLDLESVRHSRGAFDRLSLSIEADVAALGILPRPEQAAPTTAVHVDPHVALLPALRQAYAWDRAARPIGNIAAFGSPEEAVSGAVQRHCWDTAKRIIALPAPRTLAGLGALALALSVHAEEMIGTAECVDERRHAAAIRAMMSIAGVDPLPGWCGFGDEPDGSGRYGAMLEQMGTGSLPAWALAGKSGPDDASEA